jgi:hypothetical protein
MRIIAIVVGAIVSVGCGMTPGSASPSPTAVSTPPPTPASSATSEPIGTVTLNDAECDSDLAPVIPAEFLEFSLASESSSRTVVGLFRIPEDHTFAELTEVIAEERRLTDEGKPPRGHPDWLDEGTFTYVEPGASSSFRYAMRAGIYTLICLRLDGSILRPFRVLGPFTAE